MARESGFSLIEVLIAIAIAAMMVIGGFQLFGQTAE
ncbi:prepilin-type N-terminal cleavage/methylation domain-containing protein [Litoricolaceae bacterium]|nr:prepilin-type N-terminal cleavage/methylation domain-containing protein [Litorivicinaceae bacterium]